MAIYKNVASQKIAVFAYDSTDGSAKTGDAANITAQISKDGAATAATNDTNPTELDATDAPGIYLFDMTQAETNADLIVLAAVSSTSDILLDPVLVYTTPGDNTALDANVKEVSDDSTAADNLELITEVSNITSLAIDASGHVEADVVEISGDSTAANNLELDYDGTGYDKSNSTIGTCTTNTDMRGTDSAYTGTPPTAAAIVDEWESQSQTDPTGFHVNVKEVNGTAQTANDNGADINAILTDTNELQTNQGDWATATGFSTHSAADAADAVWDEAASGHTGAGTFGEQCGTDIDAILADTDEMQKDDLPNLIPSAEDVADQVWDETTSTHTTIGSFGYRTGQIETDTNELQGDWTDGGRLDLILDELTTQGDTNEGKIDTIDGNVDSILTDTAEIGAAGAGLTEAGGTGDQFTAIPWNASWDAEVQSEVADALEETIADSIPADGSRPSVKQGIYMLTQFMTERSISSTTMTVKKPDGSTSLFTLTLDDDTTPTSVTRAT
ncbi:MAG: hypothetical protein GF341_04430 [candidate division Zixibacteria bacterium]|nr:hypothetical protein [candidate division Zixibacteria bacterium]